MQWRMKLNISIYGNRIDCINYSLGKCMTLVQKLEHSAGTRHGDQELLYIVRSFMYLTA